MDDLELRLTRLINSQTYAHLPNLVREIALGWSQKSWDEEVGYEEPEARELRNATERAAWAVEIKERWPQATEKDIAAARHLCESVAERIADFVLTDCAGYTQ